LQIQLDAFKKANHVQIAALAVKSKLVKAKLLPKTLFAADSAEENNKDTLPLVSLAQELKDVLEADGEGLQTHAEEDKAKSTLLSSKLLAEEVSKAVQEITSLLDGRKGTHVESKSKALKREGGEDSKASEPTSKRQKRSVGGDLKEEEDETRSPTQSRK
jgi:hypothetical protein